MRRLGYGHGFGSPAVMGGAAAPPSYGPELLSNTGFDSGTGWTLEGDPLPPVIALGKLHSVEADLNTAAQDIDAQTAGTYHLVYALDGNDSAGVAVDFEGGGTSISRTTTGTFTEDVVVGFSFAVVTIQITSPAGVGTIGDNISLRKVL